jgi:hypothetical protein
MNALLDTYYLFLRLVMGFSFFLFFFFFFFQSLHIEPPAHMAADCLPSLRPGVGERRREGHACYVVPSVLHCWK